MNILSNSKFELIFDQRGAVQSFKMKEDLGAMNWVVDPAYLLKAGYEDRDKLFGEWTATVDGQTVRSAELEPQINVNGVNRAVISYDANGLSIGLQYDLEDNQLRWKVKCVNRTDKKLTINGLHVWFSLAYIMFRDDDVIRNMEQSCAVFAHMGGDYSKFAAMRRSNKAPHLGIYGTKGRAAALGTLCRYENRFLEQVSPSLDGLLFHRISLIEDGSSMPESAAVDWIYKDGYGPVELEAVQELEWEYVFAPVADQEDFYQRAREYGHPRWSYTPVLTKGGSFEAELELARGDKIQELLLITASRDGESISKESVMEHLIQEEGKPEVFILSLKREQPGEHKLELHLESGRKDVLVWNVLEPIDEILEKRAEWLCSHNYDPDGKAGRPHAFIPLSNQGESLGKLTFLLMKNKLTGAVEEQVEKAETSAVLDMKRHWFEHGDFAKPRILYGTFYRIFDLDYIAHVFYLLSCMPASMLKLNSPETYLQWAAEVMVVRLNPDCHQGEREKDETGLNGVFILYVHDLLKDLQDSNLHEWHRKLLHLWNKFGKRMEQESRQYGGAITEHFYDNAGFGPTCEALLLLGKEDEAREYGELILANIGFSNDYRAQNPDRWWEALSYMIHSLWGGMVASSARTAYEHFGDPRYLEAAYRSTMAIFNCYDWNVVSTPRRLQPGEAASTFSVAAPNLNMPTLSRNRFGQSVFRKASDPLFASLFANVAGDDWDMGEELVAYLLGFGTTAYVYKDLKGRLYCVNGYLTQDGDSWIITSYAAYPQRFVMLDEKLELRANQGESLRQARLANGELTRIM
ncbi:hypothetical protein SAMN04488542_10862 [Fontibacillus panacisegetis]|uniref:Uncharacterized protein n=1 Tax=Fontibacillus panacisegetis TaxID=670482 RepID=A0A1G7JPK2_9BACL|nr:hypothetical protein [Fontibacillus panacisegetis]SDF26843.1 hypothetical protein SAMN04488542_10862 [Fontibacillus panacisegetis]